jgi:peptidoglycan/LPS O-acetylase OafA/YrhL
MKSASESAHMPQLDGLRALAVTAVAVSHWTPAFLVGVVPWGTGVQLFFVLSGFLITGILLRSRPADAGVSMLRALGTFYARRFLRIFPLYYGVLVLCLLFGVGTIYETWPWHFTYLSNFYYWWHGHGDAVSDPFLHLWSLSVEEQFYLLWPLIALVASRRALLVFLGVCIVGAAAFRVGVAHLAPTLTVRYLTPSCVDALAVGGLLAYAQHYQEPPGLRTMSRVLAGIGIAGLLVCVLLLSRLIGREDAQHIGHTFLVVFYGAIVGQAAIGFGSVPGKLLTIRPVRYLGRISYGLYVFHYFAPAAISSLATWFDSPASIQRPMLAVPAYTAFTVIAAMISWHFYEWPINRLKRHFPYPNRAGSPSRPLGLA